jgi:Holliday junction resolvase RusA-like endonuclease
MRVKENGRTSEVLFSLNVFGYPRSKGSVTIRGRQAKEPDSTTKWTRHVAASAKGALPPGWRPIESGVEVILEFRVLDPIKKPDIDKLTRAVLDSISMGTSWGAPVIKDDAQVTSLSAIKSRATQEGLGVFIWLKGQRVI